MKPMGLEESKLIVKFQKNDIDINFALVLSVFRYIKTFVYFLNGSIFVALCVAMLMSKTFAAKYYWPFVIFVGVVLVEMLADYIATERITRQYVALVYNSTMKIVREVEEYQALETDEDRMDFVNEHYADLIGMTTTGVG